MSNHVPRSLRPVLAGSMLLFLAACRADRSDRIDATPAPPDTTTWQNAPPLVPNDMPSAGTSEPEQVERMPVAGRDEPLQMGGGGSSGGAPTGLGGSAGHGGKSSH